MDIQNKSHKSRYWQIAVGIMLCALIGAGFPRFTFAAQSKNQSIRASFQKQINHEYNIAHYDYVQKQNPYIERNNKINDT